MAKIDVSALKAAGFTEEQIAKVVGIASAKAPAAHKCKVLDYTTVSGNRYKALNVASARVFVKVADAAAVIKALQDGLTRAEAGECDEVKVAKGEKPTE
jgi:hypothetical protein